MKLKGNTDKNIASLGSAFPALTCLCICNLSMLCSLSENNECKFFFDNEKFEKSNPAV